MSELGRNISTAKFYAYVQMEAQVIIGNVSEKVFNAVREIRKLNHYVRSINSDYADKYLTAYKYLVELLGYEKFHDMDQRSFLRGKKIFFNSDETFGFDDCDHEHYEYYMEFVDFVANTHGVEYLDIQEYLDQEFSLYEEGLSKNWED